MATGDGEPGEEPRRGVFQGLVGGVRFFTHNNGAPVRVCRYSLGSTVSLGLSQPKEDRELTIRYIDDETSEPAAIGFEQYVDGIRFKLDIKDEHLIALLSRESSRTLRAAYLKDLIQEDPRLRAHQNSFALASLANVFCAMVLSRALYAQNSIEEALAWLRDQSSWGELAENAMFPMFGMAALPSTDDSTDDADDAGNDDFQGTFDGPRMYVRLRPLLDHDDVREILLELGRVLFEPPNEAWYPWLRRRLRATIAGALLRACCLTVPDSSADDLIADIENESAPDEIWISETVLGGAGLVEHIQAAFAKESGRFFMLAELACQPTDLEVADENLRRALHLATVPGELAGVFTLVRDAKGHNEALHGQHELRKVLTRERVMPNHAFMVWINSRILRPGTTPQWDAMLCDVLDLWQKEEQRLGLEIDLRVFCYIATVLPETNDRLAELLTEVVGSGDRTAIYRILQGLLWPHGEGTRRGAIDFFNRFAAPTIADPLLLRCLVPEQDVVDVEQNGWFAEASRSLADSSVVVLQARSKSTATLQKALLTMLTNQIEAGFLRLFPHVVNLQADIDHIRVTLHLLETNA